MARTKVYVPRETAAVSVGADEVALAIAKEAKSSGTDIELIRNGSWGATWLEPLVEVQVDGTRIAYGNVSAKDVDASLELAGRLRGTRRAARQNRRTPVGAGLVREIDRVTGTLTKGAKTFTGS